MATSPLYGSASATIASGATESSAIELTGHKVGAILFPSTFTGTSVSIKASLSKDGPFVVVKKDDGTTYSVAASASTWVSMDDASYALAPFPYITLLSDATELGERTLYLALKT